VVNRSFPLAFFRSFSQVRVCAERRKIAEWSLTNGVRVELRAQGTLVVAVYASFIDTDMGHRYDMAANIDAPKVSPEEVAATTIEGITAGHEEVLADKRSPELRAALVSDPHSLYRQIQQSWDKAQQEA
jgi:short-subunit dehydrogenase